METINLKNLTYLYGGAQSYDKCKSQKVSQVMEEYKQKKLKDRAGKTITNQKQAIAIALNQAQSKCEYNPSDIKKLVDKVNDDLNDKNKQIILSNLIETKDAIEHLLKKGKPRRVYIFKKLLWDKIIKSQIDNEKLDKNMWEEIKKIHEMN